MILKLYSYFMIIVMMAFALNCTVKKDVPIDIEVAFPNQNNSYNRDYTQTALVDPRNAGTSFDDYKDNLENIKIQSVKYYVSSFTGSSNQTVSGTLKVAGSSGGMIDFATINEVALSSINGQYYDLPMNDEGKNKLAELILNSPNKGTIYFYGKTNQVPLTVSAKLKFEIFAVVKVSFP